MSERRIGAATAAERTLRRIGRFPGVRPVLLHPVIARPGYWLATAVGLAWGAPLSRFRVRRRGGLFVCERMPRWAFARGGTMVGAAFWTHDTPSDAVVRHEGVHRLQWKQYGLAFPLLYAAAGASALTNRFEVAAGLEDGGYLRPRRPRPPRR